MYNPQIKTFIVVADAGSFNKAAEQLFVSSTAIIKQNEFTRRPCRCSIV